MKTNNQYYRQSKNALLRLEMYNDRNLDMICRFSNQKRRRNDVLIVNLSHNNAPKGDHRGKNQINNYKSKIKQRYLTIKKYKLIRSRIKISFIAF